MNYQLADSKKRFNYLLGQTELFQHFIDLKVKGSKLLANQLMRLEEATRTPVCCHVRSAAVKSGGIEGEEGVVSLLLDIVAMLI